MEGVERRKSGGGGLFSLHPLGQADIIASAPLEPAGGVEQGLRTITLAFALKEPTRVEPRITGGNARLWLQWVVFETAGTN
jgi:hypothetical protein